MVLGMNGLIGQLPEWMRSPATLIAGGLILLFLLVVLLRRRAGGAAHGLPSGRAWRGKVPLPTQASPLDAMRAALESSRRIEPLRQSAPPPTATDVPSERTLEAEGTPGDGSGTTQEVEGASVQDAGDADATGPAGDAAAKVVPLRSTSAPGRPEGKQEAADEGDGPAIPEAAREQKG